MYEIKEQCNSIIMNLSKVIMFPKIGNNYYCYQFITLYMYISLYKSTPIYLFICTFNNYIKK